MREAADSGVDSDIARRLALAACRGDRWIKRKFKKLLLTYAAEVADREDRLFMVPPHLCPERSDLDKSLGRIYDARSGNLHTGVPFPRHVGIGTSPRIRFRDLPLNQLTPPTVPPVTWFENLVSTATRNIALEKLGVTAPFVNTDLMT